MAPPEDLPTHELANTVLLARLMVEGALLRQESRGSQYREDFPGLSDRWQKHIVLFPGQFS